MTPSPRQRMLDTTADLLRSRGFHGTSLKEVLARSGAPRGSLYYYFPAGKEQLVLEALLAEVHRVTEALRDVLQAAESPADGVRAYYAGAARELRESGYRLGCPVAPVILDAVAGSARLEEACREALATWRDALRGGLERAGVAAARAAALAELAVSALEGALLVARAQRDVAPIETVAEEVAAAIEAALP